jgi:hypothetical protein
MEPLTQHWQTNVAGLDDVDLLRFMAAVKTRLDRHAVALEAAAKEARRRNLLPTGEGGPRTVTRGSTYANEK